MLRKNLTEKATYTVHSDANVTPCQTVFYLRSDDA